MMDSAIKLFIGLVRYKIIEPTPLSYERTSHLYEHFILQELTNIAIFTRSPESNHRLSRKPPYANSRFAIASSNLNNCFIVSAG